MERHKKTDEVFVLVKGWGILIIGGNGQKVERVFPQVMEIGKVYNVRVNTWHTILLSRDASVLLMEERSTTRRTRNLPSSRKNSTTRSCRSPGTGFKRFDNHCHFSSLVRSAIRVGCAPVLNGTLFHFILFVENDFRLRHNNLDCSFICVRSI